MNGKLNILGKDAGFIMPSEISYRLWDSFDFIGDQSLGNWNGDVFDATKVSLYVTNVAIENKDFREFYRIYTGISPNEGGTPWDFDIITKNNRLGTSLVGLRYTIDALGNIKAEPIK